MRFARAAKEDATLRKALESVVLVKIDRSDDANDALVESFGFSGIPHFFLLRPDGAVRDRWVGYLDAPSWLATFEPSLADDTTLEEKAARFAASASAADAAVLGRIRTSEDKAKDAVFYYREAIRLDPSLAREHLADLLYVQTDCLESGESSFEDVRSTAGALFALPDAKPSDLVLAADTIARIAREKKDWSLVAPYLGPAIAASEGETGWVADARRSLEIVAAMYVDGDAEKGVRLKRESMPDDWETDPGALNAFAWWCFENGVNLEEAEALAKRGAELAADGDERAMILDTVAEIRNARGDPADAVVWIEKALAAEPGSDYYRKQKARFEEAAAALKASRS